MSNSLILAVIMLILSIAIIQHLIVMSKFNQNQEDSEFEKWFYEQMKEDN